MKKTTANTTKLSANTTAAKIKMVFITALIIFILQILLSSPAKAECYGFDNYIYKITDKVIFADGSSIIEWVEIETETKMTSQEFEKRKDLFAIHLSEQTFKYDQAGHIMHPIRVQLLEAGFLGYKKRH